MRKYFIGSVVSPFFKNSITGKKQPKKAAITLPNKTILFISKQSATNTTIYTILTQFFLAMTKDGFFQRIVAIPGNFIARTKQRMIDVTKESHTPPNSG